MMTAGAYLPVYSALSRTSQMEGLLARTPTMLAPFFTLALLETGSAGLRRLWGSWVLLAGEAAALKVGALAGSS